MENGVNYDKKIVKNAIEKTKNYVIMNLIKNLRGYPMKKKIKGIISLLLAMTTAISLVVVPKALEKTTSAVETEQYVPMITATPKEAEMVKLLQGDILEFSSNYAKTSSKKYLPEGYGPDNVHRPDEFAPKAATLTWECQEDANYYTLKLSQ